jgi:hemolysin III
MTEIKNKYTHSEEVANAASHLVGTIMSIVVCSFFVQKSILSGNALSIFSLCLYFFGVVSSYVASSVYHSCPLRKENFRLLFRKFDYAAIYWHIAGGVECD